MKGDTMVSLKTGLITVAVLALVGQLHAAGRPASRVEDLQVAKERVARSASQTKGGPQHLLLQEQRKLSDLIDRRRSTAPSSAPSRERPDLSLVTRCDFLGEEAATGGLLA